MIRVALRAIRAHLGRLLLSVVAVMLGVAFVAGTFSLRATLSSTFDGIVDAGLPADVYVRAADAAAATDAQPAPAATFPLEIADALGQVDGVRAAIPEVSGPIVLVGADGTAVVSQGPPSFGLGLHESDPEVDIVAGRAPERAGEIALESSALESSGLAVGDETSVVLGGEVVPVEVVGELRLGAPVAGATIVVLDAATATSVYAPDGRIGSVAVYAEPDVAPDALAADVSDALGSVAGADDVEVVTGDELREESREQIGQVLGFVSTFLLVFAGVALFVGAFIIANTFQMIVRQRQREYAMLRAIGASPTQVLASILLQAAVVGVIGSALGVGAGVALVAGLREAFARFGMELSGSVPLDTATVVVSLLTGTLVSVVAAAVPARRAAVTPPVEAMRDDVVSTDGASRARTVVGALLLAGGVAAVAAATAGSVGDRGTVLGVGAA
uniref:FtsX-like permease family protein n=1 Tax=Actinotalea sp. JY-7885 TaxID=2758576 RepID=UPI00165EA111